MRAHSVGVAAGVAGGGALGLLQAAAVWIHALGENEACASMGWSGAGALAEVGKVRGERS